MEEDFQHLRLLSIFHYVVGGIIGVCGCFPIIHLTMGIAMVSGAFDDEGNGPPAAFGWIFVCMAAFMISMFWGAAIAILLTGGKLRDHSGYTFCLVVAAVECTFMPFGTVLGVFTIIVLMRPSVKELFGVPVSANPPSRDSAGS